MHLKKTCLLLLLFTLSWSGLFAQYNYDVGLKVSTNELERFQLEGRYHFKSPFSLLVFLSRGSELSYNRFQIPLQEDSLYAFQEDHVETTNHSIRIGVQRKLGFLATDAFYVGASLGMGHEKQYSRITSEQHVIDSIVGHQTYSHDVSVVHLYENTRALKAELVLSAGMDVPLTNRFSVNAELGLRTFYRKSLNSESSFLSQRMYVSGGLRYSFGKREG